MNPKWLAKYRPLSDTFMAYGWFVPPFLTGAELKVAEDAADYIVNNPPQADQDRKDIENRIYRALAEPAFHPSYRARATWIGNQLNHFRDFNHHYESAIFSYYKREYLQAVLCLLTALEGVMLSFCGYSLGSANGKPSIPDLIQKIRAAQSPFPGTPPGVAHDMYRDTLVKFLEEWIYKNTNQSDFTLSVLNRHYVLHGMDAGNFYRPQDLHRLILAFDLVVDFLSLQQKVFHTLLPDPGEDKFIDTRRAYYEILAHGIPTAAQSWRIEREMLKQHSRYIPPPHVPNMTESLATSAALMKDLMAKAEKARKSERASPPEPNLV